jgi:hypothetical protein
VSPPVNNAGVDTESPSHQPFSPVSAAALERHRRAVEAFRDGTFESVRPIGACQLNDQSAQFACLCLSSHKMMPDHSIFARAAGKLSSPNSQGEYEWQRSLR